MLLERPLTQEDLTNGITVKVTPAPEGETTTVTAKVTDPADNSSLEGKDESVTDLKVPGDSDNDGQPDEAGKPVVTIQDGDDGKINPADVDENGKVEAKVTFPENAGYSVGDTVKITDQAGSVLLERPLTQEDLTNGITVKVTPAPEGETTTVTAKVTDPADNSSLEGKDESVTDLKVPGDSDNDGQPDEAGKPVVTIQDGDDGKINPADVDENGKVDAKVTFPENAGYSVGDTVKITDQAGSVLLERPLTQEDLTNGITVKVTPAPEGETTTVTAKVTDPADNSSLEGKDESVTDLKVPGDSDNDGQPDDAGKPVVTIQDGDDGKINPADVDENGKVEAKVTFPPNAGYSVGDTVKITDQAGSVLAERPLTQEDITNGITVKVTPTPEGETTTVTAKVVDGQDATKATPEGSDSSITDLKVPGAPRVEIQDKDDGKINPADVDENGKVTVTITPPSDTSAGDKVIVNINGKEQTIPITKDNLSSITLQFEPKPEGENNIVTAKVVDGQDETKVTPEGKDESVTDLKVPGDIDNDGQTDDKGKPIVTIQDGNDGFLNANEIESGQAKAIITFPENAGYSEGDTLTVTNPDGSKQTYTLTTDDINSGKEVSFPVVEGQNNTVKAQVTDKEGNPSLEGEDSSMVDTLFPSTPDSVVIGNGDDYITSDEISSQGEVPVTVTLPKDAKEGDKVIVTPEGKNPVEKELTDTDITAGKVTVDVPAPDEGEKLKVNATVKDPAGNESKPATDEATRDTSAPNSTSTSITINTVAGDDNKVSQAESAQPNQAVTGKVEKEFKAGDKVVIKLGDEVIGEGTVNTDGTFSIDVPTEKLINATDKQVTATVTATDAAGNKGDIVSVPKPYEVGSGRSAPTVIIGTKEDSPYGDNVEYITKDEITTTGSGESAVEKVSVKIAIPADAQAGDTLTLTTNTDTAPITYTVQATDIGQTITQSVTAPADGAKLNVSATITAVDDASVVSTAGAAEATRDTSAAIGITIGEKPFFAEHLDDARGKYSVIEVSPELDKQFSVNYLLNGTVSKSPINELPWALHSGEVNKQGEFRSSFNLPTDAKVGDTLTYTITMYKIPVNSLKEDYSSWGKADRQIVKEGSHTLTQADIDAGKVNVMAKAPEVQYEGVEVKATLTDQLGNTGEEMKDAMRARMPVEDGNTESADIAAQISLTVKGSTTAKTADNSTTVAAAQEGVVGSKLTYTLNLSLPAISEYKVAVKLNVADTTVDVSDYTVDGATFYPQGLEQGVEGSNRKTTAPHVIVTIPKGAQTASFTITPNDDNAVEGTEYITAQLSRDVYNYGETEAHKASGKFYGYSEQDTATAAILDAVPPTVSIAVTGDITEDVLYPATEEDTDTSTVLTYTVSLDQAKATDTVVKVALTGKATPNTDYTIKVGGNTVTGEDYSQTLGEGEGAETLTGKVIEITIPAGETSATFTIDPVREENGASYNFEGPENVIATIQASTDNKYTVAELNETANSGERAIGLILDANPIALPHLNGDISLAYGESASHLESTWNKTLAVSNTAKTVSTVPGKDGNKDLGDALVMTDRDDNLFIGYYSNGAESRTEGNFANFADSGASGKKTDDNQSLSTIDTGKGNDVVKVKGAQIAQTRLYLGEGNDTYELGGSFGATKEINNTHIFAESGDDTIKIGGHLNGFLYTGSGSDTVTVGGIANGDIDLGSGQTMPNTYLATYQDGSDRSLGNDNNTDLATDTNTLTINGEGILAGTGHTSAIYGGAGNDNVIIEKGSYVGDMDLANGDNKVTIKDNLGIAADGGTIKTGDGNDQITIEGNVVGNSKIETGSGDDTVTVGGNFNGTFNGGEGNDTLNVGGDFSGTFNGGEGNDTLTVTGSGKTINFANILNVETIDLNGSGANTLTNVNAENVNKSAYPIYIKGGADDKVNIGHQGLGGLKEALTGSGATAAKTWSKGATVEKDGISYDTWSLGDDSSTIYIQQGVEVI
ncbi:hypothetical protein [Pelistega ratti]|uniref:hypothetical protein n=1 Tax=Pelistega ratti TaxID=2652177 RepID=UPI00195459C8|nr:hypothetical protein [Pelistega ratti]